MIGNENEAKQKSKARLWLENFWYHYKWQTIFGVFFSIVAVICIVQTVHNNSYDTHIIYAGNKGLTPSAEISMEHNANKALQETGTNISLTGMHILTNAEIQKLQSEGQAVNDMWVYETQDNFYTGFGVTANIYFLSPALYETVRDEERFAPISDYVGGGEVEYYDDYGVYLHSIPFGDISSISSLPDDTIICICKKTLITPKKEYQAAEKVLREIFAYTHPETAGEQSAENAE